MEQLSPFPSPHPQSNDEGAKEQKRAILVSLKWGEGWSSCSIYFVQDCRACYSVLGDPGALSGCGEGSKQARKRENSRRRPPVPDFSSPDFFLSPVWTFSRRHCYCYYGVFLQNICLLEGRTGVSRHFLFRETWI